MKHRAPAGSSPVTRKNKGHDINIKKKKIKFQNKPEVCSHRHDASYQCSCDEKKLISNLNSD